MSRKLSQIFSLRGEEIYKNEYTYKNYLTYLQTGDFKGYIFTEKDIKILRSSLLSIYNIDEISFELYNSLYSVLNEFLKEHGYFNSITNSMIISEDYLSFLLTTDENFKNNIKFRIGERLTDLIELKGSEIFKNNNLIRSTTLNSVNDVFNLFFGIDYKKEVENE